MSVFYTWVSKNTTRQILCCPGPVQLHRSVKRALAETQICHRDGAFEELQEKAAANIRAIAKTDADTHKVVFITGSGTSANETVTVALGKLGRMLVVTNGEFGERLYKLADLHHEAVDQLVFGWGETIDLKKVAKALKTKKYASVIVVHHETSTGMLNPVAAIARLAHERGAVIFVDTVSGLGAERFEAAEWGIDAFVSSSGKALAAVPGIGIVGIRPKLAERIATLQKTVQYLDLPTYVAYADNHRQTPNTPSVHVLAALEAATGRICRMGLERYQQTIQKRAQRTRAQLRKMGLSYYDHGANTSSVITCVQRRGELDIADLLAFMRARGIVLYGGKGELEGKIFQIGHIGELSPSIMRYVMNRLQVYITAHRVQMSKTLETVVEPAALAQEVHHAAH